jgi:hypothetical protein
LLSAALWHYKEGLLLHVVNRQAKDSKPVRRKNVKVQLPVSKAPKAVRIVSPDWEGERRGEARIEDGRVVVTLPVLSNLCENVPLWPR